MISNPRDSPVSFSKYSLPALPVSPVSIKGFSRICRVYYLPTFVRINFLILEAPTAKTPALNAFAAEQNEDHTEGEAWGVDGDLLLDEEGNPEMDEIEMIGGEEDEEGGWDVS